MLVRAPPTSVWSREGASPARARWYHRPEGLGEPLSMCCSWRARETGCALGW
jgi:hypothetical protein